MVKRLDPTPETVHFGFYDATLAPVLELEDGEVLSVGTVSADPNDPVPVDWLPPTVEQIHRRALRGDGPHILSGPVWVKGARPGDILEVQIRDIQLNARYAYNVVSPLKGFFAGEHPKYQRTIMPIDQETGRAEVIPGMWLPTRPFFGQLGVAPPPAWGRIDSRPPRAHGGNMDNKELLPGTRVFLPVWVEGALFSVGDGHAMQGDGEINQTAVEASMEGEFRLRVRREATLELPFAVTPEHLMTMAFNENLEVAARQAMRTMIRMLEEHYGLSFHDAYRLCSAAADIRVTQVVNQNKGIHVMLPLAPLAVLGKTPWFMQ